MRFFYFLFCLVFVFSCSHEEINDNSQLGVSVSNSEVKLNSDVESDSPNETKRICQNMNSNYSTNFALCSNYQSSIADITNNSGFSINENTFGFIDYELDHVFYFNSEFSLINYGPSFSFDETISLGIPGDVNNHLFEVPDYDFLTDTYIYQRLESDGNITPSEANEIRDHFVCYIRNIRDSYNDNTVELIQVFDVNFVGTPALCSDPTRSIAVEFKIGINRKPIKN